MLTPLQAASFLSQPQKQRAKDHAEVEEAADTEVYWITCLTLVPKCLIQSIPSLTFTHYASPTPPPNTKRINELLDRFTVYVPVKPVLMKYRLNRSLVSQSLSVQSFLSTTYLATPTPPVRSVCWDNPGERMEGGLGNGHSLCDCGVRLERSGTPASAPRRSWDPQSRGCRHRRKRGGFNRVPREILCPAGKF